MTRYLTQMAYVVFLVMLVLESYSCHKPPSAAVPGEKNQVVAGAYYFDGWTGKTHHITPALREFPERMPSGGWVTSTAEGMEYQINLAADAGIAFFNFCWYYSAEEQAGREAEPLNQGLRLYLASPAKTHIRFSLLVANHAGYLVGPGEWLLATRTWVKLFRDTQYLRVAGKPYISFFSLQTLLDQFGSAEKVKWALNELRQAVRVAGFDGVSIGVCVGTGKKDMQTALACGFDLLTSYNDHAIGFKSGMVAQPVSRLIRENSSVWDKFRKAPLPYIPTATLGWDMRPWTNGKETPYYTGYSGTSVYASVRSVVSWVSRNNKTVTKEKLVLLYAWNEYGEGAWLTPSEPLKDSLLQGVRRALKH